MAECEIDVAVLERLKASWAVDGIDFPSQLTIGQVTVALSAIMEMVPHDLQVFYSYMGGIKDGQLTSAGFSLWNLNRVISVARESQVNSVIIGDYGIDAWYLSVLPEDPYCTSVWYEDPFARGNGDKLYGCLNDFAAAMLEHPTTFFEPP